MTWSIYDELFNVHINITLFQDQKIRQCLHLLNHAIFQIVYQVIWQLIFWFLTLLNIDLKIQLWVTKTLQLTKINFLFYFQKKGFPWNCTNSIAVLYLAILWYFIFTFCSQHSITYHYTFEILIAFSYLQLDT